MFFLLCLVPWMYFSLVLKNQLIFRKFFFKKKLSRKRDPTSGCNFSYKDFTFCLCFALDVLFTTLTGAREGRVGGSGSAGGAEGGVA